MPTYEYQCRECGQRFDVVQSMNDPRLESCLAEGCPGTMKRLIGTGAGIIFKGSGFYQTDYRSDSYKAAAKKDSEGGSSTPSKDQGKTSDATSGGSATPKSTPTSPASSAATSKPGGGN